MGTHKLWDLTGRKQLLSDIRQIELQRCRLYSTDTEQTIQSFYLPVLICVTHVRPRRSKECGKGCIRTVLCIMYQTNSTGLLIWLSDMFPLTLGAFHSTSEQELTCTARTDDSEMSCEFVHDSCDKSVMCSKLLEGPITARANRGYDFRTCVISFSPKNPPQETNCATSCPFPW